MSSTLCQCGQFAYCIPRLCQKGLKVRQRGSEDRRVGRFGVLHDEEYSTGEVIQTGVKQIISRSIISSNSSPDVPWNKTVNPYQGCEHGCVYCYARPSHAYLGLSPALDFETKLFAKMNASELLRNSLSQQNYVPTTIGLGTNTDCYQPIERRYGITRKLLEVFYEFRHPISVLTKNSLIERDIDVLSELAKANLVEVHISVTTLDKQLSRILEPRASLPKNRLRAIEKLAMAGIPVKAMVSPLIPQINLHELHDIMKAVKDAGATSVGYILLRMPHEVRGLFSDWLERHYPSKKVKVLKEVAEIRSRDKNRHFFEVRMHGHGRLAEEISVQFREFYTQLKFRDMSPEDLDITQFTRKYGSIQIELF